MKLFERVPLKINVNKEFEELLDKHLDLTRPKFSEEAPKNGVKHYIATIGPPIHSRALRLAPDTLSIAKKEFDEMEANGIVKKLSCPWSSPLQMTPKSDCSWRHAETTDV